MKNRVIAISREFGSGGRTIGRRAAEMLNVPCYDQELIEKNAAESGFAKEFVAEHGEAPLRPGGFPMFLQSEIITATPCRMTFGSFSGRSSYHWQKKDPV